VNFLRRHRTRTRTTKYENYTSRLSRSLQKFNRGKIRVAVEFENNTE